MFLAWEAISDCGISHWDAGASCHWARAYLWTWLLGPSLVDPLIDGPLTCIIFRFTKGLDLIVLGWASIKGPSGLGGYISIPQFSLGWPVGIMNFILIFGLQGSIGPTHNPLGGSIGLGTPVAPSSMSQFVKKLRPIRTMNYTAIFRLWGLLGQDVAH